MVGHERRDRAQNLRERAAWLRAEVEDLSAQIEEHLRHSGPDEHPHLRIVDSGDDLEDAG